MTTMRALRAHAGADRLQLEQVDIPEPERGEVRVRVLAAGMAPGMLKLLQQGRFRHLPTVVGHEIAGMVDATGPGVDSAWLGARVRVHPMLSCGACDYCRGDRQQMCAEAAMVGHAAFGRGPMPLYARYHNGGLADFVCAPTSLLDRLPEGVGYDVGAKVHDLANAVRALRLAGLPASGRLIITAATGTMGVSTIRLARWYGARELVLVGRSAQRLEEVAALSDLPIRTVAISDTEDAGEHIRGLWPSGADAVIDYLPAGPGSAQVIRALGVGGTLVHMGANAHPLGLSLRDIMVQCWRVVGTRACTRSDTEQVLQLLAQGDVRADDLITHRFALADIHQALEATHRREGRMWMTVIHPAADAHGPLLSPDGRGAGTAALSIS